MIRPARPSDQAFIASTWTRSICSTHKVPGASTRGHAYQRHIGSSMWERVSKQVDAVMDRSDSRAIVTCHPTLQDNILGWAVYVDGPSVPTVHYCYVRKEWRDSTLRDEGRGECGFARGMLEYIGCTVRGPVVCTSLGPSSAAMMRRYKAASHMSLEEFLGP